MIVWKAETILFAAMFLLHLPTDSWMLNSLFTAILMFLTYIQQQYLSLGAAAMGSRHILSTA